MATIIDLLSQAELALSAYSTLPAGINSQSYIDALKDNGRGLAPKQAEIFASTYIVIQQYSHPANGLSVTVFADAAGNKYLAIRGTNDLHDLLTDIVDIALAGSTQWQSQYASLKAKVTEWLGNGTLSPSFTVTGHSLGGFLATGIAADFAGMVGHAYLFNAPGIDGVLAPVLNALGVATANTLDPAKISNIKAAAGLSPIASLGTQVSPPIWVEIEDQTAAGVTAPPASPNHSQRVLTDALALHTLYATLDPTLSQDKLNALVDASGTTVDNTLESALDALRTLMLGPDIAVDGEVFI